MKCNCRATLIYCLASLSGSANRNAYPDPDTVALHWTSASSSTGVPTRDTTAEVNTSFSEDLAGPYLLVWDLSSRTGTVELRFTEVITLEVNLAKTLL